MNRYRHWSLMAAMFACLLTVFGNAHPLDGDHTSACGKAVQARIQVLRTNAWGGTNIDADKVVKLCNAIVQFNHEGESVNVANALEESATTDESQHYTFNKFMHSISSFTKRESHDRRVVSHLCTSRNAPTVKGKELAVLLEAVAALPSTLRPGEVYLRGFRVVGPLRIIKQTIPYNLNVEAAVFCGNVELAESTFDGELTFSRTLFLSKMKGADNMYVEGIVNATGTEFQSNLYFHHSRIGGIDAEKANVRGYFSVSDSIIGFLSMRDARISMFSAQNTTQSGYVSGRAEAGLVANNTLVKMEEGATSSTRENRKLEVSLSQPRILSQHIDLFGSYINMIGTVVDGMVFGDNLYTDGPIVAVDGRFGIIRFRNANVFGANFGNVVVDGDIDMAGTTIGRNSHAMEIDCDFQQCI